MQGRVDVASVTFLDDLNSRLDQAGERPALIADLVNLTHTCSKDAERAAVHMIAGGVRNRNVSGLTGGSYGHDDADPDGTRGDSHNRDERREGRGEREDDGANGGCGDSFGTAPLGQIVAPATSDEGTCPPPRGFASRLLDAGASAAIRGVDFLRRKGGAAVGGSGDDVTGGDPRLHPPTSAIRLAAGMAMKEGRRVRLGSFPFPPLAGIDGEAGPVAGHDDASELNLLYVPEAGEGRGDELSPPPPEGGLEVGFPLQQPVELLVHGRRVRTTFFMHTSPSAAPAVGVVDCGSILGQQQPPQPRQVAKGSCPIAAPETIDDADSDGGWPAYDDRDALVHLLQKRSGAAKTYKGAAEADNAPYSPRAGGASTASGGGKYGYGGVDDNGDGAEDSVPLVGQRTEMLLPRVEMIQLRRLRGEKRLPLEGFMQHRLDVAAETVRTLEEALVTSEVMRR